MIDQIFSCTRCGFCCQGETTVSLDKDDQKRMLQFLDLSRAEALEKYWNASDGQIQMKTVNGHCIFYDNGCTVHPGRPWRCREWPFVNAILLDETNFGAILESCPGFTTRATYSAVCKFIREGGFVGRNDNNE